MKITVLSLADGMGTARQDFLVPPLLLNTSSENKPPRIQTPALRAPGNKTRFLTQSVPSMHGLDPDSMWQVHNLATVYLNGLKKIFVRCRP